jgi:hypothetical protein
VGKLLEWIPKSWEQKRETQRKNREIELEPAYKELYDKLKHTYDEYLNRPEYRKVGFPTVTIDRTFLHCDDIDDRVQLCSYDLWKNDENLCCVISWKNLDERANAAKHAASLMLKGPETSLYQSEQEMREYQQQQQQAQLQAQQQQAQMELQFKQAELEQNNTINQRDNETKLMVANIQAASKRDADGDGLVNEGQDTQDLNEKVKQFDQKMKLERDKFEYQKQKDKRDNDTKLTIAKMKPRTTSNSK